MKNTRKYNNLTIMCALQQVDQELAVKAISDSL